MRPRTRTSPRRGRSRDSGDEDRGARKADRGARKPAKSSAAPTKKKKRSSGYQYKSRGREAWKRRQEQSGGQFDSFIKTGIKKLKFEAGDYDLRFCPPGWDDPDHYGWDIYVHYGVGADGGTYICPNKQLGKPCPICEDGAREARRKKSRRGRDEDGDDESGNVFKVSKRVGTYVIDRENEEEGPQFLAIPWTLDTDFAELAEDRKTREYIELDDPVNGRDVQFTKKGQGLRTKYTRKEVSSRATPLCDDPDLQEEWLDFIRDNAIPDILRIYDYDHLKKVYEGVLSDEDGEDDDEPKTRASRRAKSSRREDPDDESEEEEFEDPDDDESEIDDDDESLDDEPEEEEEDLEEEEEPEEEEEEEPEPPRRKSKPTGKPSRTKPSVRDKARTAVRKRRGR